MEEQLDDIEKGKAGYVETLRDFYKKFKKDLKRAGKEMPNFKEGQPTGVSVRQVRQGEWSRSPASSASSSPAAGYPDCDNTPKWNSSRAEGADRDARGDRARTAASRWS